MTDTLRVVSTTPSGTEILFALGIEPVAVSHACDHPAEVEALPRINTSRVDADRSADRDEQATGTVYDVDGRMLRDLEPDLIVTQSVCGVCAVDEALIERHVDDLEADPTVLALSAGDLDGVADSVRAVGRAVGRPDRAEAVVDSFRGRIDRLADRTATADARPSTVVLEWMDPLHAAANWVPELVSAAGGRYPLADPGARSRELDWADVRACDPEVLVVAPCSFDRAETLARVDELRDRAGWGELRAVREGRVHALDGRVLNRWTPRLADAAETLAALLNPEAEDTDAAAIEP